MYLELWHLKTFPFNSTPNTQAFYQGGNRQEISDAIEFVLQRGDGIIKVTGEVGVGKSTLLRYIANDLAKKADIIYINAPDLDALNLLRHLAQELRIPFTSEDNMVALRHKLYERLLMNYRADHPTVVMMDEAQAAPKETLEAIRLLSNLETDHAKLLQILLFGQNELNETLELPEIRQLKDRITHSFHLAPFNDNDTASYIHLRLTHAGYQGSQLFSRQLVKRICAISEGYPRKINKLCDLTLLAAFADRSVKLLPKHLKQAEKEFFQNQPQGNGKSGSGKFFWIAISVVLFGVLVAKEVTQMQLPLNSNHTSTPAETIPNSAEPINSPPSTPKTQTTASASTDPQGSQEPTTATPIATSTTTAEANALQKLQISLKENPQPYFLQLLSIPIAQATTNHHLHQQMQQHMGKLTGIYRYQRQNYDIFIAGPFANRQKADEFMQQMPIQYLKAKPYLRNTQSIMADLEKIHLTQPPEPQ